MNMQTKLETPAYATKTSLEDFASTDFSALPGTQSEAIDIEGTFRLIVGPDPVIPGHYGLTVKRLDSALTISFDTCPLDDLSERVRYITGELTKLGRRERRAPLN